MIHEKFISLNTSKLIEALKKISDKNLFISKEGGVLITDNDEAFENYALVISGSDFSALDIDPNDITEPGEDIFDLYLEFADGDLIPWGID